MIRRATAALAAMLTATAAPAQSPQQPRLEIEIAVDGLSSALFDEYRPHLSGGLVRAASGTGAAIQQSRATANRVVAVSGSAAAAATATGASPSLNWNGRGFAAAGYAGQPPQVVALANMAVQKLVAQSEPALVPPPYCQSKARPGGTRFARAAGDYAGFERSPSLDGATLALAARLAQELKLGNGAGVDLLSVRLSATGNVVRAHGSSSEETCLQLFALDRELRDFLRALESMGIAYSVRLELAN